MSIPSLRKIIIKMKKSRFPTILLWVAILSITFVVHALLTTSNKWWYKVVNTTTTYAVINSGWAGINSLTDYWVINAHEEWKSVTNKSCVNDVFVPTKTFTEFVSRYDSTSCTTVVDATPVCWEFENQCDVWDFSDRPDFLPSCWYWICISTDIWWLSNRRCYVKTSYVDCNVTVCQADVSCDLWCFIAWTMITMADGSKKDITLIATGDQILGSQRNINTVVKLYKIWYQRKLYAFNWSNNYFVSDTHPFLTTEGWKSFYPAWSKLENPELDVTLLEVWDILITDHGQVVLNSVDSINKSWYVYNFKTDWTHDYIADWFVVHNPAVKDCTSDPRAPGCECDIDPSLPECIV